MQTGYAEPEYDVRIALAIRYHEKSTKNIYFENFIEGEGMGQTFRCHIRIALAKLYIKNESKIGVTCQR